LRSYSPSRSPSSSNWPRCKKSYTEKYFLLGCDTCICVEIHRPFGRTYCLSLHSRSVSKQGTISACCLLCLQFDIKMEAAYRKVGEFLPDYTESHPEGCIHHGHCCGNLKSKSLGLCKGFVLTTVQYIAGAGIAQSA
jgi:hypothetical protein